MKKLFLLIVLASCVSILSDVAYAGAVTNTTPAPDVYGQVVRIAGGSRCKATAAPVPPPAPHKPKRLRCGPLLWNCQLRRVLAEA